MMDRRVRLGLGFGIWEKGSEKEKRVKAASGYFNVGKKKGDKIVNLKKNVKKKRALIYLFIIIDRVTAVGFTSFFFAFSFYVVMINIYYIKIVKI